MFPLAAMTTSVGFFGPHSSDQHLPPPIALSHRSNAPIGGIGGILFVTGYGLECRDLLGRSEPVAPVLYSQSPWCCGTEGGTGFVA